MTQVWYHWHRVWIYVVLLIPLAVLVVAALTKARPSKSWRRSIAEVGMFLGTLPWVWMILTPMELPPDTVRVYLVPLSDLWAQLKVGEPFFVFVQVSGNLAVLFALGAFTPLRFAKMASMSRLLLLGLAVSLTIELLQHAFVGGRVFSVDDVLLNALGCVLGGVVSLRWWRSPEATQY